MDTSYNQPINFAKDDSLDKGATDPANKEKQCQERLSRQERLKPGEEFRPHRLFNTFGIVPYTLMSSKELTASEKLLIVALSLRLGEHGTAHPCYKTLGEDIGVTRRQAVRLANQLKKKNLLRTISRYVATDNEQTSNEFKLLWSEIYKEKSRNPKAKPLRAGERPAPPNDKLPPPPNDKLPAPPSDKLHPPPSDKLPPPPSHKLSPEKKLLKKRNISKREMLKVTSSSLAKDDFGSHTTEWVEVGGDDGRAESYCQRIQDLLSGIQCVAISNTNADKKVALEFFRQNVAIQLVEYGVRLTCLRWYMKATNVASTSKIHSLRYFENEISEAVSTDPPLAYREHVKRKLPAIESQWLTQGTTLADSPLNETSEALAA